MNNFDEEYFAVIANHEKMQIPMQENLINDYSRIDRKISSVNYGIIELGEPFVKKNISTIDSLVTVIREIVSHSCEIICAQWDFSFCVSTGYLELLIQQLVFDILFDKYYKDSPMLTLHQYCKNHIHYGWDKKIYSAANNEKFGITQNVYHECIRLILPNVPNVSIETQSKLIEDIKNNPSLKDDCEKITGDISEYVAGLIDELSKAVNRENKRLKEAIKHETIRVDNPLQREDTIKLGADPDIRRENLQKLNKQHKNTIKRPKYMWDYLYYNSNPDLITYKQYKRSFVRDSNTGYDRFIQELKDYDRFISFIVPKENDDDKNYFYKSMDYYDLEIYKRIDFIYKLAVKMEEKKISYIDKYHFWVRRFHPVINKYYVKDNEAYPHKINKYYRPMLLFENTRMEKSVCEYELFFNIWQTYHLARAKSYESFKYLYEFSSDDYHDISEFIRSQYNILGYHVPCKEWTYVDENIEKLNKIRIKNVIKVNDALFWKSDKHTVSKSKK